MDFYKRALELRGETTAHRRYLHENAEAGMKLPKSTAYVREQLSAMGIEARACGEGVTAALGNGGRTILLRADMDALPMREESGLPFACPTGEAAHCCGHDLHTAMLLTAAKLLKEREHTLRGTVRLMFQTGEEVFGGAENMIAHGILENPRPDAALAFHVGAGKMPVGLYMYNDSDAAMMFSVDAFSITAHGKGTHGAYPHMGIDPIHIAAQLHLALTSLTAREGDPTHACALTIGSLHAGSAPNIIPDTAELQGTLRTNNRQSREKLAARVCQITEELAAAYGGEAQAVFSSRVPPLYCAPEITREMAGYIEEMNVPNLQGHGGVTASASEDFALVAERIPSTFIYLSAGYSDERGEYPAHNAKVQFNEDVLPFGAAAYAHCAARYLEEHDRK
ncbi:MAG: amidohydrolase [Oscillospiraceae bacterium]|nr:amidohydrolase [Oscillospiraceae bacterium]